MSGRRGRSRQESSLGPRWLLLREETEEAVDAVVVEMGLRVERRPFAKPISTALPVVAAAKGTPKASKKEPQAKVRTITGWE